MRRARLGLAVILHPYEEGADQGEAIFARAKEVTRSLDLDMVCAPGIVGDVPSARQAGRALAGEGIDGLCLVAATWSADHLVLELLEEVSVPMITWALPGISTGSLCGSQQICCVLNELGRPYQFVYGTLEDRNVHGRIRDLARGWSLARQLRQVRLGLIGYRISGMTEVAFDEIELKALLGPRTVHIGLGDFDRRVAEASGDDAASLWASVKERVGRVNVPDPEGIKSARAYCALRDLARTHELSGFAFECYPDHMGLACLAASLLAEEGIIMACEGDMNSAVAMLALAWLSGGPVQNTDLLAVDERKNTMVLSHCGSGGFSLAEGKDAIELAHVRLAHSGVCVLFPCRPGPVTMVNLVGRQGTYRMGIVEGGAIQSEMVFAGNPVTIVPRVPVTTFLERVAEEGLGHHWMIGYGDHRPPLEAFAGLVGLRRVVIGAS